MTYEEIISKVKKEFGSADVSNYEGHLALQINITGEGAGSFYTEINDGQLFIEPFDYKDNDAMLTACGDDIVNILSGKIEAAKALESGKLSVEGDYAKAFSIQPIIENNVKTTSTKKKTAKTETVTKTSVKAAAKTAAKSAVKTSAPKTAEKAQSKTTAKAVKDSSVKTSAKTAKTSAKKG